MNGHNVVRLHAGEHATRIVNERGALAMLVFVAFEGMMFVGLVSAFMLTRAASGSAWPPPGPWFPQWETAINTAALLASGALIFRAARVWPSREARIGPLLVAAITLGAFFLFFQGVVWVDLVRDGLTLASSHPGVFFCLIVGTHGANVLVGLVLLGIAWLRLKPFRDDVDPRGSLSSSAFSAARILWYFAVGVWPVLYVFLYV